MATEEDPVVERAKNDLRDHVRGLLPDANVLFAGGPTTHAYWTIVRTDAQRDALKADAALDAAYRRLLVEAGYPPHLARSAHFAFESRETVDRDWAGSLWHAMK